MKLKKLLLPIASAASVAAVVAPVVTSCGSGIKLDGTKIYVPKAKQAVWDMQNHANGYSKTEATTMYLDDMSENPQVFADDMLAQVSVLLYALRLAAAGEEVDLLPKLTLKYSNIKVNPKDETSGQRTISYKVSGSCEISGSGLAANGQSGKTDTYELLKLKSFSVEFDKIPFTADSYSEAPFEWSFSLNDYSKLLESSSATAKANGYIVTEDGINTYNNDEFVLDKDHAWGQLTWAQGMLLSTVGMYLGECHSSYHMANILFNGQD